MKVMNKIMLFAWMYIIGIVIASIYVIPFEYTDIIFKVAYGTAALFVLTIIFRKERLNVFTGIGKIFGYLIVLALAALSFFLLRDAFAGISSISEAILKILIVVLVLYILGSLLSFVTNSELVNVQNLLIVLTAILLGAGVYTNFLDTRDPHHIVHFTQDSYGVKQRVVGRVVAEPLYMKGKVRYVIKPIEIQPNIYEDTVVKIRGRGYILFQASAPLMYQLDIAYGDLVELKGTLLRPRAANNPGGFDYREFLRAQGIYATMYARYPNRSFPPITKLEHYSPEPSFKNIITLKYPYYAIFNFSLMVKDKMLRVIKQTMKHPTSAFVGGVTLGLRYGLDGVYLKGSKTSVKEEFKHSGVNHVLAVSGLHVTIITIMFVAIFAVMRVPRKIQPPIIIFFLIVFTIITGARPSTMRAAIMNSLVLLTWVYLGPGLRSSLLFGISVAALLILIHNPLLIYQASFTLSFGAVLSLGLLTGPIERILNKYLVGEAFIAGIIAVIVMVAIMFVNKANFQMWHLYIMLPIALIAVALAYHLRSEKLDGFAFSKLPNWLGGFISAQFGIALGMMFPLSWMYFGQYPIAGSFANFVAIPLIGVVVQLGMIAGILAMIIPYYGIWLAFIMGAGNYIFSMLFLKVAHYATVLFPYPVGSKFSIYKLLVYYAVLALFIWWRPVSRRVQSLYYSITDIYDIEKRKWPIIGVLIALAIVVGGVLLYKSKPNETLKIVVLDVSYGGGTYIKFPSGKTVLIDGAYNDLRKEFDAGQRVVGQALLKDKIQSLEAVVLTNPERQNISGLHFILMHFNVKKVYDSVFHPDLFELAEKYKAIQEQYNQVRERYIAFLEKRLDYEEPADKKKKKYVVDELNDKIEELEILADEMGLLDEETDKMREEIDVIASQLRRVKEDFLSYFEDEKILQSIDKWWVQSYVDNYIKYLEIIKEKNIPIYRATYGDVVYSEDIGQKHAELFVLNPRDPIIDGSYSDLRNNGVVLRLVYGKFSMLFPGEVDYPALNRLVDYAEQGDYSLKSTVLMVPNHGSKYAFSQRFLEMVDPEVVILQYGSASNVRGKRFARALSAQMKETMRRYREYNKEMLYYTTYGDGAVIIKTDGEKTEYICMADLNIQKENKRRKDKLPPLSHKIKDKIVGKININKATIKELTQLPRIGYSKARAIVKYREEIGGFTSIEQIMDIRGIGPKTFEKFKNMISIEDEEEEEAKSTEKSEKGDVY